MYEYQTGRHPASSAYHVQATEDHEAKRPCHAPARRPYKPTPLRLPFLMAQMLMLCACIGVVVYAILAMPDSDSSARGGARAARPAEVSGPAAPQTTRLQHRGPAAPPAPSTSSTTAPSPSADSGLSRRAPGPSLSQSVVTKVITISTSTPYSTRTGTTREHTITVVNSTVSQWKSTSTFVSNGTTYGTVLEYVTRYNTTIPGGFGANGTLPGFTGETSSTVFSTRVITNGGTTILATSTSDTTLFFSSVSTSTEIQPDKTYLTLGEVLVTSVYTVDVPQQVVPPAVTRLEESVLGPATQTVVEVDRPAPQVVASHQTYQEVWTPPPQTVVTKAGGGTSFVVFVTQPTPENQAAALGVERTVDGRKTTVFEDGVPSGQYRPITVTAAYSTVETIETTIGGTPTVILSTRTFSSVIVTTPSGSAPLTFTVVSSLSESLVTLLSTRAPTTVLTTSSGSRTTTPEPSTRTRLSTSAGTTVTRTSIATPTQSPPSSVVVVTSKTYRLGEGEYFVGVFLPLLVAIALSGLLRIVDNNAKLYQPFHALAGRDGATADQSLTLQYSGLLGLFAPLTNLAHGYPVPFVSQTIVLLSSLLVPLAAEAMGLKLHGCTPGSDNPCAGALGVSLAPAYALIAVLALIVVLLGVLVFLLRGFGTGVLANPWSVAGIASLAANPDIRVLENDEASMKRTMERSGRRYAFGYYENHDLHQEYGLVLLDESGQGLRFDDDDVDPDRESTRLVAVGQPPRVANPFLALTAAWRSLFIVFLCGIFAVILYYHLSLQDSSSFIRFMDSHSFGVRFLFALLGVVVTFCWISFFTAVACVAPFRGMLRHSQPPERSILVTRCSNGFYGLYRGVEQRDPYVFFAALMTCLSEFLPMTLSNVPFTPIQTRASHDICARLSMTILGAMIVVMLASWLLVFPLLPADPRTIGGLMYFVTDSYFLRSLEGVSLLRGPARKRRIQELGRRFYYGEDFIGRSGCRRRGGIDSDAALLETLDHTITAYSSGYTGQGERYQDGHL